MRTSARDVGRAIVAVSTVISAVMAVLSYVTNAAQIHAWLGRMLHMTVLYRYEIPQALFILTLLIMLGTRVAMLRTFRALHHRLQAGESALDMTLRASLLATALAAVAQAAIFHNRNRSG